MSERMIGFQAPFPEAGFSEKLSEIPLRFREAPVKNLVAFLAIRGPGLLRTAPRIQRSLPRTRSNLTAEGGPKLSSTAPAHQTKPPEDTAPDLPERGPNWAPKWSLNGTALECH